jgi:hypothetical protein
VLWISLSVAIVLVALFIGGTVFAVYHSEGGGFVSRSRSSNSGSSSRDLEMCGRSSVNCECVFECVVLPIHLYLSLSISSSNSVWCLDGYMHVIRFGSQFTGDDKLARSPYDLSLVICI